MLLPSFSDVRYTPLTEKPWSNRRTWVGVLKYAGIVLSATLLVLAALHVSGIKRMTFSNYNGDITLPDDYDSAAAEKLDSSSPPATPELDLPSPPATPELDTLSPPAADKLDPPPPPPAADEPLLGEVRGPDTIVIPHIPQNFKIVGLVFFGRKSRVEILDCYLKVKAFRDRALRCG
jgi:hypothetical protein